MPRKRGSIKTRKTEYNKIKGKTPVYKVYHNTRARGTDGSDIRPFVNPVFFEVDPWCGCTVVYAPMAFLELGQTYDKPMALKFRSYLCTVNH